jgi:uncharacterized cupredoxin-like copper-binding protein
VTKRSRALVLTAVCVGGLAAAASPAMARTYNITAGDLFFRGVPKTVPAGTHTFVMRNTGQAPHNFAMAGKRFAPVLNGGVGRITVTLRKGKSYNYLCTVPGHAQAGMKGTIRAR